MSNTNGGNTMRANGHGKRAESARGSENFGVYTADQLQAECGFAVAQAVGVRKRTARRLGRSVDVLDKYIAGDKSNPVYRYAELINACEDPYQLEAFMRVVTLKRALKGKDTSELVTRWHEIVAIESDYQSREDSMTQTYYSHRDLLELGRAHRNEGQLQLEFDAICQELHERGIDPLEES